MKLEDKDDIRELFQQKLKNHEVQVKPELWSAISSNLTPTAAAASPGLSSAWKWFIGLTSAASLSIVAVYLYQQDEAQAANTTTNQQIQHQEAQNELPEPKAQLVQSAQQDNLTPKQAVKRTAEQDPSSVEEITAFVQPDFEQVELQQKPNNNGNKTEASNTSTQTSQAAKQVTEVKQQNQAQETTEANEQQQLAQELEIGKVPNVITPNNDGINDLFSIELKGIQDFSITILDRENKKVFSSTDPDFVWNGTDPGENQLPSGAYIYFFSGKDSKGKTISKSGYINLER